MNLTEEEYLHLVDQMTLLRMQNERYLQDNTILLQELENQKFILEHPDQPQHFHQYYNLERNNIVDSDFKFKSNPVVKNIDNVNPYRNELTELESMSQIEQNRYLKEEIKQLRKDINAFKNEHEILLEELPSQKKFKVCKLQNNPHTPLENIEFNHLNNKLLCSVVNNTNKEPSIPDTWMKQKCENKKEQKSKEIDNKNNDKKPIKESGNKKSIEESQHKKNTESNFSQKDLKKEKENDDHLIYYEKHGSKSKIYIEPKQRGKSSDRTNVEDVTSEIDILKPTLKRDKSVKKISDWKEEIELKGSKNKLLQAKVSPSKKDIEKKSEKLLKSTTSVLLPDKEKSNIKKVRQSLKKQPVENPKPTSKQRVSKKENSKEKKKELIKGHS